MLPFYSLVLLYPSTHPPTLTSRTQNRLRVEQLRSQFRAVFGGPAAFLARSPGRVNLIGEHIDYSMFSVLPMALEDKDIWIAVQTTATAASNAQTTVFAVQCGAPVVFCGHAI